MTRKYEAVYVFDSTLEDAAISDKLGRLHGLLGNPGDLEVNHVAFRYRPDGHRKAVDRSPVLKCKVCDALQFSNEHGNGRAGVSRSQAFPPICVRIDVS